MFEDGIKFWDPVWCPSYHIKRKTGREYRIEWGSGPFSLSHRKNVNPIWLNAMIKYLILSYTEQKREEKGLGWVLVWFGPVTLVLWHARSVRKRSAFVVWGLGFVVINDQCRFKWVTSHVVSIVLDSSKYNKIPKLSHP